MRELSLDAEEIVLREQGRIVAREPIAVSDDSLREVLRRVVGARAATPTRVRVAASRARIFLMPWVPQLTTPQRWRALAASRFEQSYGELPDDWSLRVADDLPPRPRLAVALPVPLLRTIQDVVKPRRLVIGLLEALGALLVREPAFHGCVAQIGPKSACLLMICGGELRRVRTRRYEAPEEIIAAARSEWAAAAATREGAAEKTLKPAAATVALLGTGTSSAATLASALGASRVLELA